MKVAVCSDLHLEFGFLDLKNTENADVLVISGDVLIAQYMHDHPRLNELPPEMTWGRTQATAYDSREFLDQISKEFKDVIVIAGNHEFYHGKWIDSLKHLKHEYSFYNNIHFLERDTIKIGDVNFVGGTLWTNMNNDHPDTMFSIRSMMNDFNLIRHDGQKYRKVSPVDAILRFEDTLSYFKNIIKYMKDEKVVMVSHHSPSFRSVSPKYVDRFVMNGGYCSNLSEFILDNPQIKLWVHGHIHTSSDYNIGDTRIVCNPRGYKHLQEIANEFKLMYIEV